MAKQSGPESVAQAVGNASTASASVPAPADSRSTVPSAAKLQSIQADTVEVVEWDTENGVAKSVSERPAEGAPPKAAAAAEADIIEHPDATPKAKADDDAPDATKAKEEPDPEAAKAAQTEADKRRAIFASLEAERTKRSVEDQAKKAQTERDEARAEVTRIKGMPLKEKLAWLGIDPDELADKLLIKSDDVQFEAPRAAPAAPAKDPEVAALLKWKADREAAEQAQEIRAAHGAVADALKDVETIPITAAMGKWGDVLALAHEAWTTGGKAGHVRDYLPDAAELVEQGLRRDNPSLAALADRAKGAKADPPADDEPAPAKTAPAPRVAAGTRTAARPDAKPKELPEDRLERDAAIKAEMRRLHPSQGWGD